MAPRARVPTIVPLMLRLLALLLALAAPAASGTQPPSRTARHRAVAAYEHSAVRVRSGRQVGPGIIVGAQGQVLTALQHVGPQSAQVEVGGKTVEAQVVLADTDLKVALVAAPAGTWPSVAVHMPARELAGQWLLAVLPGRGRHPPQAYPLRARRGRAPFFEVGLPLPPGSPLFDTQGRLVALVVERRGSRCRALPLEPLKRRLAQHDSQGAP